MDKDLQQFSHSDLQRTFSSRTHPHSELTRKIIGAAIEVHKGLGPGFLERTYEEALSLELDLQEIPFERQKSIRINYKGVVVGLHRMDLIIENRVVVELKAVKEIQDIHIAICLSYLKSTGHAVGLIINFAEKIVRTRRVYNPSVFGR